MAVAAFKSTSKRTPIGARDKKPTTETKGRQDPSQNGAHSRRSNDFSDNVSQISSSSDSFLNGQIDFGTTTDNPLFRGSTVLEEASRLLRKNKDDSSLIRGRSLARSQPNDGNSKQSEVGYEQRRGRSVSRQHSTFSQNVSNQKACTGSGRRGRSLSRGKYYESEGNMDSAYNRTGQDRIKNIGVVESQRSTFNKPAGDKLPGQGLRRCSSQQKISQSVDGYSGNMDSAYNRTGQDRIKNIGVVESQRSTFNKPAGDKLPGQGLRRCSSQQKISQSVDGYSSCVSSLTGKERPSMHPDECVEEKTIKSVYEQIKSFQSDHPTGDKDASGLYEVIRSEVQHAVGEIRFDLEQAIGSSRPSSPAANGSINVPQSKSTDDNRQEYFAQLEESEKRARHLWLQFTVEEQRCKELSRIVKDLLPDTQLSKTQKPSRIRKNSTERRNMSRCLTEDAQSYFDEFVSISTLEDSEMSSLEELENVSPIKTEKEVCYERPSRDTPSYKVVDGTFFTRQTSMPPERTSMPPETDGVVIPWLKFEENDNLNTPLHIQKSEAASDASEIQRNIANEVANSGSCKSNSSRIADITHNKSSCGSCSTNDRSLHNISYFSPKSIESQMSSWTRNPADRTKKHEINKNVQSFVNASQRGFMKRFCIESSSSYLDDEYFLHVNNEDVLVENLKVKNIIDYGGLLLCNKLHL